MEHPRANRSEVIAKQQRKFRRMLRELPDESRRPTVDAAWVEFVKAHPQRSVA